MKQGEQSGLVTLSVQQPPSYVDEAGAPAPLTSWRGAWAGHGATKKTGENQVSQPSVSASHDFPLLQAGGDRPRGGGRVVGGSPDK